MIKILLLFLNDNNIMSEEEEDELYYENLRKLAYNFENFYDDSYTEEPNEILYTGSSPTIVVTDDLSIFEEDKSNYYITRCL